MVSEDRRAQEPTTNPVRGDPLRAATPVIRGFRYQVLQSLLQWLHLDEGEQLYLEHAEDIALLRESASAHFTQVKARSDSLTLASKEAIALLNHHWEHVFRNPDLVVHTALLSTQKRGVESGKPLGPDGGLAYWEACHDASTPIAPLSKFLLGLDGLAPALRKFLDNASDAQVRDELIRFVSWRTEAPTIGNLEDQIESLLADLFATTDPPRTSAALEAHLWRYLERGAQPPLTRRKLLRTIERADSVALSPRALEALLSVANSRSGLLPGDLSIQSLPVVRPLLRSAATGLVTRRALLECIEEPLATSHVVFLHGSSGMGKTTLVEQLADRRPDPWYRLDLRDLDAGGARQALIAARPTLPEPRSRYLVDDVGLMTACETALVAFVQEVVGSGGAVVITSARPPTSAVSTRLGLVANQSVAAPPLTEEEISEMLALHNCPPDSRPGWVRLIAASTSGHPQLVHARVRHAEREEWALGASSLLGTEAVAGPLQDARDRLVATIPSEAARDLCYRLSLALCPMERAQILGLGGGERPGESLDALVGPWVEQTGDGLYRVSVLLRNAGQHIYDPNQLADIHNRLAQLLASSSTLTPSTFEGLVVHAILGRASESLARAVGSALRLDASTRSALFRSCSTLRHITPPGRPLLLGEPSLVSVEFRRLQYSIASEVSDPQAAGLVADAWRHELDALPNNGPRHESKLVATLGYLVTVLANPSGVLSPGHRMALIEELATLQEAGEVATAVRDLRELVGLAGPLPPHFLLSGILGIRDHDEAERWLDDLIVAPSRVRHCVLSMMSADLALPNALMLGATAAADDPERRHTCLIGLERLEAKSGALGSEDLLAAARRARVLVEDEANNTAQAARLLTAGDSLTSRPHVLLQDYDAKMRFKAGDFEGALRIWSAVLPLWSNGAELLRANSYRDASVAAAELKRWDEAIALVTHAASIIAAPTRPHLATGYQAERAYYLWHAGQYESAIAGWIAVLDACGDEDESDEARARVTERLVGHAIAWASQVLTGQSSVHLPELPFGSFSQIAPRDALLALPALPRDLLWAQLGALELRLAVGSAAWHRAETLRSSTAYPAVAFVLASAEYEVALGHGPDHSFAMKAIALADATDVVSRHKGAGFELTDRRPDTGCDPPRDPDGVAHGALLLTTTGLLALAAQRRLPADFMPTWEESFRAAGLYTATVRAWFHLVSSGENSEETVDDTLRRPGTDPTIRFAAAIVLSTRTPLPDALFYCHLTMFDRLRRGDSLRYTGSLVEALVCDGWRYVAKGQRFAVRSPLATIPTLLEELSAGGPGGLPKVARVLLAAQPCVHIEVPAWMLDTLRATAGTPP